MLYFVTVIVFLSGVFLLIAAGASFSDKAFGLGLVFILVSLFTFFSVGSFIHKEAYKNGQIDAAIGKQKYHLTTQPDKTMKWELKEE